MGTLPRVDTILEALLTKPNPKYQSTSEDREDFKQLFTSGQIIRNKGVYASPNECQDLYDFHMKKINELRESDHDIAPLHPIDALAVRTYSISSNELNDESLRTGDKAKIAKFAPYIKCAISGLNKLPVWTDHWSGDPKKGKNIVYRGKRLHASELSKYKKGERIRELPFLSTTYDNKSPYRDFDKYNVQYVIKSQTGKKLGALSIYAHLEDEVLFPPATPFDVDDANYKNPAFDPNAVILGSSSEFEITDIESGEGGDAEYPHLTVYMTQIIDEEGEKQEGASSSGSK